MAVKVIDPTPDPKVIKRVSCDNCGARLEYVPMDVKSRAVSCMGDTDTVSYIVCPQCQHNVTVR
jgi:RNase P subunit RPR2